MRPSTSMAFSPAPYVRSLRKFIMLATIFIKSYGRSSANSSVSRPTVYMKPVFSPGLKTHMMTWEYIAVRSLLVLCVLPIYNLMQRFYLHFGGVFPAKIRFALTDGGLQGAFRNGKAGYRPLHRLAARGSTPCLDGSHCQCTPVVPNASFLAPISHVCAPLHSIRNWRSPITFSRRSFRRRAITGRTCTDTSSRRRLA